MESDLNVISQSECHLAMPWQICLDALNIISLCCWEGLASSLVDIRAATYMGLRRPAHIARGCIGLSGGCSPDTRGSSSCSDYNAFGML